MIFQKKNSFQLKQVIYFQILAGTYKVTEN